MNKGRHTFFILFIFLFLLIHVPANAQVGTPMYHFTTRNQVEVEVKRNRRDMRKSYNVIMCAMRQGMIKSAVHAYETMLGSDPFGVPAEISSSFAFAHALMVSSVRWDWKKDNAPGITHYGTADALKVAFYREQALKKKPNSPEVLLEYAIWAKDQDQRPRALQLVKRALAYSPKWADLQWWYGRILDYRSMVLPATERAKQGPQLWKLAIKSLEKSETLDPKLRRENLIDKAYLYLKLQDPRALGCLDAYARARPDFVTWFDANGGSFKEQRSAFITKKQ